MRPDVLIVGAGSAGSVLAEQLSFDERCHVTVLEAGPDSYGHAELRDGTRLPIGPASAVARHMATSLTDAPPRPATLVRGSVVGGSGAINGGYFCRGRAADFDGWNTPGWSWSEVLPHFRAVETDLDYTGPLHGSDGPIRVRRTEHLSRGTSALVQWALDHGYPWLDDLNGAQAAEGVGAIPLNIVDGVRVGPGAAFLDPARRRPNLTVRSDVTVQRLRLDDGRATAVDLLGPAGAETLYADRIVLCAGAIGSAQLLMVSGVGPAGMLGRAGIEVAVDLPVGTAFCDHPEWVLPVDWPAEPGRPPLEAALAAGDVEIRFYTTGFAAMTGSPAVADPPHIGIALMRPRTRGRMTVISPDVAVAPVLEQRYDTAAEDVHALRQGAEMACEIGGVVGREAFWSTTQHLSGTAPMGPVLDEQCRVRGVTGLWVVDGSVMPALPSRGPHASIVMIGHRAAQFIG